MELNSEDQSECCPICLDPVKDRAFANSCMHIFCYACLWEWSKRKAVCPMCKQKFYTVIHNIRSFDDYDEETVQTTTVVEERHVDRIANINIFQNYFSSNFAENRPFFHYRTTSMNRRPAHDPHADDDVQIDNLMNFLESRIQLPYLRSRRSEVGDSNSRIKNRLDIYQKNLITVMPLAFARIRECTPQFYSENEAQIHRLVPWLNRELKILKTFELRFNEEDIVARILTLLPTTPIRGNKFRRFLSPYLKEYTDQFVCEFETFASCPLDLYGYDREAVFKKNENHGLGFVVTVDDNDAEEISITPSVSRNRPLDLSTNNADDDSDCIVIEPTPEIITLSGGSDTEEAASRPITSSTTTTSTNSAPNYNFTNNTPSTSIGSNATNVFPNFDYTPFPLTSTGFGSTSTPTSDYTYKPSTSSCSTFDYNFWPSTSTGFTTKSSPISDYTFKPASTSTEFSTSSVPTFDYKSWSSTLDGFNTTPISDYTFKPSTSVGCNSISTFDYKLSTSMGSSSLMSDYPFKPSTSIESNRVSTSDYTFKPSTSIDYAFKSSTSNGFSTSSISSFDCTSLPSTSSEFSTSSIPISDYTYKPSTSIGTSCIPTFDYASKPSTSIGFSTSSIPSFNCTSLPSTSTDFNTSSVPISDYTFKRSTSIGTSSIPTLDYSSKPSTSIGFSSNSIPTFDYMSSLTSTSTGFSTSSAPTYDYTVKPLTSIGFNNTFDSNCISIPSTSTKTAKVNVNSTIKRKRYTKKRPTTTFKSILHSMSTRSGLNKKPRKVKSDSRNLSKLYPGIFGSDSDDDIHIYAESKNQNSSSARSNSEHPCTSSSLSSAINYAPLIPITDTSSTSTIVHSDNLFDSTLKSNSERENECSEVISPIIHLTDTWSSNLIYSDEPTNSEFNFLNKNRKKDEQIPLTMNGLKKRPSFLLKLTKTQKPTKNNVYNSDSFASDTDSKSVKSYSSIQTDSDFDFLKNLKSKGKRNCNAEKVSRKKKKYTKSKWQKSQITDSMLDFYDLMNSTTSGSDSNGSLYSPTKKSKKSCKKLLNNSKRKKVSNTTKHGFSNKVVNSKKPCSRTNAKRSNNIRDSPRHFYDTDSESD